MDSGINFEVNSAQIEKTTVSSPRTMQNFEKFMRSANFKRASIVAYPAMKEAETITKALLTDIVTGSEGAVSMLNAIAPDTAGTLIKKDIFNACF